MCGRFALRIVALDLGTHFQVEEVPIKRPRYNIAPTQEVLAIRAAAASREAVLLRWGLIPSWAKDEKIGHKLINARAETLAEKPSFRTALKRRRCLIPSDGFYEWKQGEKVKQPYFIHLASEQPFGFAGLWDSWESGAGPLESCTIITTEANELVRPLHERMPVILSPGDYDAWLDPTTSADLSYLLASYPADEMAMYPVSTVVNNPRHEQAACVEPLPPAS